MDVQILKKWIKTNSKIKQQQQQKLITSKTSCPFKKKLTYKIKIASDKTDIKQKNL